MFALLFLVSVNLAANGETNATASGTPGDSQSAIVVTATRTRRQSLEVPASVSVIPGEQIGASAAMNVDDCLRQVQGISVMQVMGMSQGMPSQINIRGVPGENRVLVLADGLPLNEASTRFASINEIPLSSIKQVEVIRGPFSSLYGTDAFGGVINIITKGDLEEPGLGAHAGLGNFGYYSVGADAGGGSGAIKYRIDLENRSVDNYLARDYAIDRRYDYATEKYIDTRSMPRNYDYSDSKILGKLSVDVGSDSSLSLYGRYFQSDMGYGQKDLSPIYPTPEDNVTKMRTALAGGMLNATYSPTLDLRIGGYFRHQTRELLGLDLLRMDGETQVYSRSYSESASDEWQAECGGDLQIGKSHTVSGGVEVRRSSIDFSPLRESASNADFPGAVGAQNHVIDTGLFVQDEVKIGSKLKIIGGLRYDHDSAFGSAASPRASAMYVLSDLTTVRASVGRAFRAPTLVELFQPPLSFGYVTFNSNPDLKPEHIWSTDMEIEHKFSKTISGRVGLFYNDMDDLISDQASGAVLTNVNIDQARSEGVEASAHWSMTDFARLSFSYTFQKAEDKNTGNDLEYIPRQSGSISLNIDRTLGNWRIEGSLTDNYVGRRGFSDWATGNWYELNAYWRTDLALKLDYKESYWLKVGVQNLTDAEYQESMMSPLAPGRLAVMEAGARY